jgi:hypothetical protein
MKNLICFCFLLLTITAYSQTGNYSEKEISDYIQSLIGGEREVSVPSGRIDLLHDHTAYEIEWANNWKESIGQCLWYAQQKNCNAGIILINKKDGDYKYLIQLNSALAYAGLDEKIKVLWFPEDFRKFMK